MVYDRGAIGAAAQIVAGAEGIEPDRVASRPQRIERPP